ncbi:hypothetical protein KCU91_g621, partial [Aureobasidium melanogenum]
MAENEHIMTTRAKQRSRAGASKDTTPTVLPAVPESTTTTKPGKKPVYNPDLSSDAEDNVTVAIPGRGKEPVYNSDPGSDAEDNITVLPPPITTQPKSIKGKGKERQVSNVSSTLNDNMQALSFEDPMPPLAILTNGKQRTAIAHKATPKKATSRKPNSKPPTSDYEFTDPAPVGQAPESRAVHPEYPNLPPEVPVDDEGVPTAYYAKVDGKVKIWGKKRGD